MKKQWIILILLPALFLSGCGQTPSHKAPQLSQNSPAYHGQQPAEQSAVDSASSRESVASEMVQTKNDSAPLSEDEILAAYDRAVAAYSWFERRTLPYGTESQEVDGSLYRKVDYAGINTVEDLRTYLRSIFSEDLVEELLPEDDPLSRYKDFDGELYEQPFDRGDNLFRGKSTERVEWNDDGSCTVNVTVETLGDDQKTITGVACFAFPYRQLNGRWVFTDFDLVN